MGRPKTWNREEVLRRATQLFWEKGFEGTHLQELVRVAGINRFALYKEFGGKQGLFDASLVNYIEDMKGFGELLEREPLGLRNVRDLYRAVESYGFHHGCFVLNTVREKHAIGEGAWSLTREFLRAGETGIRRNLEAARASGEIPPATDLDALALLLTALNIGFITYGVVDPGEAPRGRALDLLDGILARLPGSAP